MCSLRHNRNFVRLFLGRLITNIGDSVYYIAAMWLAYDLGGSVFYSGLAGFLTLLPEAFTVFVGPLVDRLSLKKVFTTTSLLQGLLLLIVPLLYVTDSLNVWGVLVLMPLITTMELFHSPAESALLPKIVVKNQLVKANSAMAAAGQGTELLFNSLAGVLVVLLGAVSLYVIDAILFFIAVFLYAGLKLPRQQTVATAMTFSQQISTYRSELKEGLAYVAQPKILNMLLPLMLINAAYSATLVVFPALAKTLGGPDVYGWMMATLAGGMLVGTLLSSFVAERMAMGKAVIGGYSLTGLCWLAVPVVGDEALFAVLLCFFFASVPVGATNILFFSYFQTTPPGHLVGRVAAVINSLIVLATPLGALLGGVLGEWMGSDIILVMNGVTFLFLACYWLSFQNLRRLPKVNLEE
ncbi:MFS transporter [Aureibacillus halotolerans]|nr:MFS transporter [Aureibacillus halotolerans]